MTTDTTWHIKLISLTLSLNEKYDETATLFYPHHSLDVQYFVHRGVLASMYKQMFSYHCVCVYVSKKRVDSLITEKGNGNGKEKWQCWLSCYFLLSHTHTHTVISKLSNDIICPLKNDNITQRCPVSVFSTGYMNLFGCLYLVFYSSVKQMTEKGLYHSENC